MEKNSTQVPINLVESDDEYILRAPLPGAEPENITVRLDSGHITVRATPRGSLAKDKRYLQHEWKVGDYERTVEFNHPIDSDKVNVTYDNGVLSVTMPKGTQTKPRDVRLGTVESAHGQTQGHSGHGRGQ